MREISSVKKVNAADDHKNMSATTSLTTKSRKDCQFGDTQKKHKRRDVYSQYTKIKINTINKFGFDRNSCEGCDSSSSDFNFDVIGKSLPQLMSKQNCYCYCLFLYAGIC